MALCHRYLFSFFPYNPFSTWKRRTKLCGNSVASHIFWKCWVISEFCKTVCFPLYLEKGNKPLTFLLKKKIVIGRDDTEFGSIGDFWLHITVRQRDLDIGRSLEIFALQKLNFFLPRPTFSRSSVTKIRSTVRSFRWKLIENQLASKIFSVFVFPGDTFHLENENLVMQQSSFKPYLL